MAERTSELGEAIDSVRVEPDLMVMATRTRAWRQRGLHGERVCSMVEPGDRARTARLLEGVVAAAQRRVPRRTPPPKMSPIRWAWRLTGYYHTTHATPRMMAEAAARFESLGLPALAAYARSKVADEAGHDDLALRDLRALGHPAERIVEALVPPTAAALVELFESLVRAPDPIGCIGYAYALERLAAASRRAYVEGVEAALPPGVHATRSLRVHSAIGADVSHVEDAVEVTTSLPATGRAEVARAAYRTALLCSSPPRGGHPTDDELIRSLAAVGSTHSRIEERRES